MRYGVLVALWCAAGLGLTACSSDEQQPEESAVVAVDAGSGVEDAPFFIDVVFNDGPPAPDAYGYCGNYFYKVEQTPPNLYFVLDRSGSMADPTRAGSDIDKYTAVRKACVDVVRTLGARANVGAAVFPGDPFSDQCDPGREVFETRPGDGVGEDDVTKKFNKALSITPVGGTPTSSTLTALHDRLVALPGKTVVILATDGGPNCNEQFSCTAKDCIYTIEGTIIAGHPCDEDFNCCADDWDYGPGAAGCLDAAPTVAAVQRLRDAGIKTFVVGIPGSGPYASLLDALAVVGGTALPGSPAYYRIDNMDHLGETLARVGERAAITCEFTLEQAPPEPDRVNVYLDQELVPYDEKNGWTWTSDTTLKLHGAACDKLESGLVMQVQVVAGCPTEHPA